MAQKYKYKHKTGVALFKLTDKCFDFMKED